MVGHVSWRVSQDSFAIFVDANSKRSQFSYEDLPPQKNTSFLYFSITSLGQRILRAWYTGIKNAGPRKRAQGRAQDIPYHHDIFIYIYLYICIACLYLIDYLYPPLPGDASYISWWEEQVPLQNIHLYWQRRWKDPNLRRREGEAEWQRMAERFSFNPETGTKRNLSKEQRIGSCQSLKLTLSICRLQNMSLGEHGGKRKRQLMPDDFCCREQGGAEKERVQDETSCTSSYSNTSSNESEGIDVNAIKNVRHEIWRLFIECDKTLIQARARKGEAQGVLSYQNQKGISQTPIYIFVLPSDLQFEISKMIVPFHQGTFEDDVPFPKIGWSPGPGYSKMSRKIRAMWVPPWKLTWQWKITNFDIRCIMMHLQMVGSIVMLVFQGVNEVTLVVGDRYFLRPFLGSFTPNGPGWWNIDQCITPRSMVRKGGLKYH